MSLSQREFLNAVDGYRLRQKEDWERVRYIGYFSLAPTQPKGFKLSDVSLPTDEPKETKGRVEVLTKEEVKQAYINSGLDISDKKLNEIYGK